MIGLQKRKATCSPNTINNNNEPAQNVAIQAKNSRKKAKLTGSRSSGTSNHVTKRPTASSTENCPDQSNNNSDNNQDESVWIFGLINNIEQLLSTFTAINNTSSSSAKLSSSSSGASSPSARPSSLASSTAPSPPSSLNNSSLDSTNPSNTTTCNTSTSSSSSSSSLSASASASASSSAATSSMPAAQQVAASLPRSPVSRQIKFHEYKGPPSVKRQQQSAKHQTQQSATSNGSLTSSAALQPNNDMSNKKMSLAAPQQTQQLQQQVDTSNAQLVNSTPITQQQQRDQAISVGRKSAVPRQLGSFSATIPQKNALCNVSFQQNRMSTSSHPHSLAAVKLRAQIMQQNQQQQQQQHAPRRHSNLSQSLQQQMLLQQQQQQQPVQVTSGSSQSSPASLQTFYIKQESDITLESPLNRLALAERSSQQIDDQQQQQQQRCRLEQMQHLQFPITNVELSQLPSQRACNPIMTRTIQQPSSNLPAGSLSMSHTYDNQEHQPCRQQAAAHMVQVQQRPPASTARDQQQQQSHYTVYANANHYAPPTACSITATTLTNPLISYTNDRFGANIEGLSHSTNQHIDDDELAASFGPDSEETDACEIEPSIGFTSGIDELLFSEFIDLQDVPMNVDESDWLKKFLPPCSMG